jgi:hypothetical protein
MEEVLQVGTTHYLPLGLLAHAELRRISCDCQRAQTDLTEAHERSQMGLHLADCHLERARLCLALGERDTARKAWETAKAMIERMAYHRRDGEVAELEKQLG